MIIPEQKRSTLCVSSQIGCSLNCSFCHTGTQKLERSLTSAEIVGQYMMAASKTGDFPLKDDKKRTVSNMVFMGQGEPLYNWRQVSKAIQILTDPEGLHWSKSKITVSTSGVVPLIPKVATELGVSLAIGACFQWLPQIVTTWRLGHLGSLSPASLCFMAPYTWIFGISMIIREGMRGWSAWIIYVLVGIMQIVLIGFAIVFGLRQRNAQVIEGIEVDDKCFPACGPEAGIPRTLKLQDDESSPLLADLKRKTCDT